MARRPLIAGNWKMHKTHLEGVQLTQKLAWALSREDTDAVEVVVCPPFTALRSVGTLIDGDKLPIALGAQDCHPEPQGAYTGEISAPMLAKLGVQYVIVGHSERRQYFNEDDELVNRKAKAVLGAGMRPIVCVGEVLSEREAGRTAEVVQGQVRGSLAGLGGDQVAGLVVAYEPVWAIGTGRAATADDAQETIAVIRATVADLVRQVSQPFKAMEFDFRRDMPERDARILQVTATSAGIAHGIAFWFDLVMDEEIVYSSASTTRTNHWKQAAEFFPQPMAVQPGDRFMVIAGYDNTRIFFKSAAL